MASSRFLTASLIVVTVLGSSPLWSQDYVSRRPVYIYLPVRRGATVLSAEIDARANYIAAVGDYLVSRSIARGNNAVAREHEIKNEVLWVKSYFEKKEINRAYRRTTRKYRPHLDRLALVREAAQRKITEAPDEILRGKLTDQMNWLLDQLVTDSLFYYYSSGVKDISEVTIDTPLDSQDVEHIVLTDGGRVYGHRAEFRAHEAKALQTDWPFALRGAKLADERQRFETIRDTAVREVLQGAEIGHETQLALREAVDSLKDALDREYPKQRRLDDWHVYYAGKNYLRNLAFRVFRAITTNDTRVFDGSYRFQGDTVIELIQHMTRHGFRFADPEPGDEGTYRKIFLAMRAIQIYYQQEDTAATDYSS